MRVTSRSAALLALLPALGNAVSLSDMTPRASNLPSACNKIYTSQISGCGVSDFTTQSCSDTCVEALQAMVGPIKQACGGQGLSGSNLIVAFLANVGPQQICPNAEIPSSDSNSQQQSTPSPTPSPRPSPSSSPTEASTTTTAESSSAASQSLLVDSSSRTSLTRTRTQRPSFSGTETAGPLSSSSTSTTDAASSRTYDPYAATSSAAADTQDDGQAAANAQSGGGSPFDDEGNMFSGADSLSSTSVLVSLGIAFVVVMVLFR